MPSDKKEGGVVGQIAVSILVALLAGGTSPWWWDKFFGGSNQPSKQDLTSNVSELPPSRPPQSASSNVAGTYAGSVFNKTSGQSGNVRIVLNQDTSGKITGTVNITGVLVGSGPLEGHVDGNRVGFTSVEPSTGMLITWEGILQNSEITGNYTVSIPPQLKAQGLIDQEGLWKVSK